MADEDITLDGKPLQSLRVADLKLALEQRNLPKSGQKNALLKRLKGALMLENLQKSSSSHSGLQPNSQIGEEMSQNSFIKQYLAKQQELLRQRLEREAQQEEEAEESPAVVEEDEDHSEDNDCSPYVSDKKHPKIPPKPSMTRADEGKAGGELVMGHVMMACGPASGPGPILHPQEFSEAPGVRMQRGTFHQGHKEPPAPSPPRAVASLSVRVLGQPDRQGLPPVVPRAQEKEGTAPSEPGSAHPVLHLSRSAGVSGGGGGGGGGQAPEDSDDDDDDDESEDDEDWGPGPGGARRGNRAPPQPQQIPPSAPSTVARSKRKLQPPQHIPPPQSPPDTDDQEGEAPEASCGPRVPPFPPSTMQRQDSDSSSRSSSPEPSINRRPGPLSLLVHKMESEGAFRAAEASAAVDMSGQTAHSAAGSATSSESSLLRMERKRLQENREVEEERRLKEEKEREQHQKQERERKKVQEQEREKKRLEEEKEKERKRLEEEEKQRQKEERENERKRQQEEKERERKHQQEEKERERKQQQEDKEKEKKQEEKRREEKLLKEKSQETASKGKVAVTEAQDSGSSSDSDSKSDSSSQSSSSSCGDKIIPVKKLKKAERDAEDEKNPNGNKAERQFLSKREVSEPSAAAATEAEPDTEGSNAQQPPSGADPENSEARLEESTTPKAFAARKISLTSSKTSPAAADGAAGETDAGTAAGRKRRWGSSTAVTAKKPSISITTDSLKSLIPDIKVNQEAVVELNPEELQMSGDEDGMDTSRGDQDKGLKIRRTVTQVVSGDGQENGQVNEEEEEGEEADVAEKERPRRTSRDKRKDGVSEDASQTPAPVKLEAEPKKVTPSDSLVRRSISQQKSGVSVTLDDPVRAARQPSPPHGKVSNIIHVINLVRPFTLGQLKELLNRTGAVVEEGFWIDKIKSHCYVTYATSEEAVATRAALHGVKWPPSNPKVLRVDFCEQDQLDIQKGIVKPEREEDHVPPPAGPLPRLPPLMPEREHERDRGAAGVRDLWAERQREMERRERARGEREWDRDKIREFARPGEDEPRSRSRDRERRRRERAKSKERKTDKKATEKPDEPPVKLLDDLFLKTKAAPCIYWLPLSEEQAVQRLLDRTERQKERERRRKEQQEEEEKKREEERKERLKGREKEGGAASVGGAVAAAGTASVGAAGRGGGERERERGGDRERERGGERSRERERDGDRSRDRDGDKKRDDSSRPRRPSAGAGGRRSRSRSNPRDRRR
ncbi:apoptotic chromatin condensation inducer 1b isoform X3 [Pungitius pungitius]|uniref:apoptotic chromatin condensation inducer 1b isoform X3 n=1 Tax=Pungitius pungitius TaxID=134920 RepID=UPI002E11F616